MRKKDAVPCIDAPLCLESDNDTEDESSFYKCLPLYASASLRDHNYADFINAPRTLGYSDSDSDAESNVLMLLVEVDRNSGLDPKTTSRDKRAKRSDPSEMNKYMLILDA